MNSALNDDGIHAHETREEMEDRLRRLEKAMAAMQDTKLMEDRLLERVMTRVDQMPPAAAAPPLASLAPPANPGAADVLLGPGMALLPGALRAVSNEINHATHPHTAAPPQPTLFSAQSWLLTDLLQEFRTFGVMFFDFRFRTSWTARVVPLACFIMIVLNYFMLTTIPERLLDIALVILAYKSLSREATRYRTEAVYFPPRQ